MIRCAIFAVFVLAAAGNIFAQSGYTYTLNWNVPDEELTYYSCGCADSCWVAEVRDTKHEKRIIAALRCDCEKLYFSDAEGTETIVSEDCDAFKESGKMELISKRIKELQSRAGAK
jgi:hypothetical protein